jgi:Rieske Fe-S protein
MDRLSRRALLELGAAAPLAALAACKKAPVEPPGTLVPLASLNLGERVVVMHGEEPVELLRTTEGLTARSLWCTHTGCRVIWEEERNAYRCLCHDGGFNPDGSVLYGPPTKPLPSVPFELQGDHVFLPAPHPASG